MFREEQYHKLPKQEGRTTLSPCMICLQSEAARLGLSCVKRLAYSQNRPNFPLLTNCRVFLYARCWVAPTLGKWKYFWWGQL